MSPILAYLLYPKLRKFDFEFRTFQKGKKIQFLPIVVKAKVKISKKINELEIPLWDSPVRKNDQFPQVWTFIRDTFNDIFINDTSIVFVTT